MRKSKKKLTRELRNDLNVISKGTVIEGDLIVKGDIRVDGEIKGELNVENRLVVGNSGCLEGKVECKELESFGMVTGKVEVSHLLILRNTSNMIGTIAASKLEVSSGAIFNGDCHMDNSQVEIKTIKSKAS